VLIAICAALWALVAGFLPPRSALAAELTAVILEPVDPALLERVQGQTSDLEWRLDRAEGPAELPRALEVARGARVDAVIWFVASDDGSVRVHVFDARAHRQLERSVSPPAEERLASSTTAELSAFIVRSSLQAIAAGRIIGEPVKTPIPKPVAPRRASPEPPVRPGSDRAGSVDAGGFAVAQGASNVVDLGFWLGVGFEWSRFMGGLSASTTGQTTTSFERATLGLQRQQLTALAGVRWLDTETLELWARLGFGLLLYRRETSSVDVGLAPTPASVTVSPCATPEILMAWRPLDAQWLSALAAFAIDLAPASPTIAYRISSETVDDRALFRIQPRVMTGVRLTWPMP